MTTLVRARRCLDCYDSGENASTNKKVRRLDASLDYRVLLRDLLVSTPRNKKRTFAKVRSVFSSAA
jgi:hypothetical protein